MATFPEADEMPGTRDEPLPSLWECLVQALLLAVAFVEDAKAAPAPPGQAVTPGVSLRPTARSKAAPAGVVVAPTPRVGDTTLGLRGALGRGTRSMRWPPTSQRGALALAALIAGQLPADPADHNVADHHRLRDLIERGAENLRRSQAHPDDLPDRRAGSGISPTSFWLPSVECSTTGRSPIPTDST